MHGLAIDKQGRLLAASVIGNAIWEVDRVSGAAKIFIGSPEGQADDIAISRQGAMAWTSFFVGMLRYRENDHAPIRVLAKDLPGINSLDFDPHTGRLYASQCFLGDGLWEIDIHGVQPPRLIVKDLGGLNGFEIGPDGMIYGPLWFKNQVVKVDPASGAVTVINSDFVHPAAANLDGKGNLWVVETPSGRLSKIDLATGVKVVVKSFKTGVDNLAIAPDGTIYVSNFDDNAIYEFNPATGAVRTLTSGALSVPAGLKISDDQLWVADFFSFRKVDMGTGTVHDVMRTWGSGLDSDYPIAIGVSSRLVALASWFSGTVQVLDRKTNQTLSFTEGWAAPYDTLPLEDGSVLVLEIGSGSIIRLTGPAFADRSTLATGLAQPVQMTLARDGFLYVTETAGNLVKVDPANGAKTVVATGLQLPEGVAQTPWGTFIVAEAAATRLTEFDPQTDTRSTVAENLPIGLAGAPGMWRAYVPTGVSVAGDGSIYFSANRNNAIYRVRPQPDSAN